MIVHLTAEDFMVATTKAAVRQLMAIKKKRIGSDHGGSSKRKLGQRLSDSIIGALGEIAVSRAMGLQVTSEFENMGAADIGGSVEVRTTELENGCLLLHRTSPDHRIYVLVTIKELQAKVVGWLHARDGKQPNYWRDGDPGCFFCPQESLKRFENLMSHLGNEPRH